MGFKANIKVDSSKLKKILKSKQDLISSNIQIVVTTQAIPHLIDLVMKGYDSLSQRMNTLPEDPTNPSHWRQEFKASLQRDLEQNLLITSKGLIVRLGNKEFLGYASGNTNDPNDSNPLTWMVFYIEGLVGEWAFISPEVYEKHANKPPDPSWGRFADGFMISKAQFDADGWSKAVSFEEVRHPFSGFSPLDIFTEALNEFQMKPFIARAIKAAKGGQKL